MAIGLLASLLGVQQYWLAATAAIPRLVRPSSEHPLRYDDSFTLENPSDYTMYDVHPVCLPEVRELLQPNGRRSAFGVKGIAFHRSIDVGDVAPKSTARFICPLAIGPGLISDMTLFVVLRYHLRLLPWDWEHWVRYDYKIDLAGRPIWQEGFPLTRPSIPTPAPGPIGR